MADILPFKRPEPKPPDILFVVGAVVALKQGGPPMLILRDEGDKLVVAYVDPDKNLALVQTFAPDELIQVAPNWIQS